MSAPTRSAAYTRVTLAGSRRRVDVVFPSQEPIGALLPDVIRLTGEPAAAPPTLRYLATVDGTLLDTSASLAQLGVADGALLRLVGLADAPPPPVVYDVADETADDLGHRRWRWGAASRAALAAAVLAAGCLLVAFLVGAAAPATAGRAALFVVPMVLLLAGAAGGRVLPPSVGPALLAAAATTGAYAVLVLADRADETAIGLASVAALVTLGLGLGTPLGRGALLGGLVGLSLVAAWALALLLGVDVPLVAAGAAVVSVAALGVLPRLALVASGLTALDDRRARDDEVSRQDVTAALADAHRGLALAAVAVAASAAAAGWLLGSAAGRWTAPLAGVIALVLVLRARAFPLVAPVVAIAAAAAVTGLALVLGWVASDHDALWPATALTGVVVLAAFVSLVVDPAEHTRARFRRIADRLELVAVVVSVPLAVGVSGLYGRLLEVF